MKNSTLNINNILNSIDDGIIVLNKEKKIDFINDMALELLSINRLDVLEKNFDKIVKIFCPNEASNVINRLNLIFNADNFPDLYSKDFIVNFNRKSTHISAHFSPIYMGEKKGKNIYGVIIKLKSMNNLKEIEEKLKEERDNFNNLIQKIPLGIILVDENLYIRYSNDYIYNLLGHDLKDMIGLPLGNSLSCPIFNKICGDTNTCKNCELRASIERLLNSLENFSSITMKKKFYVKNKNTFIWYKFNLIKIYSNVKVQILISVEDISYQMEKEAILKREQEEAGLLAKSKSLFLSNMSHEIRTPLNGVLGMIDLTLMTDLSDEQYENLIIAKNCSNTLLNIIDDILDFSRIEAGKIKVQPRNLELRPLISELSRVHNLAARQKNLGFFIEIDKAVPEYIYADEHRLKQVLNNLINNAIKFTEEGYIKLNLKMLKNQIRFSVEDTGIGIEEINLENIFKNFTQIDSSFTKKYKGTGLGLAISKELIKSMDSKLMVESIYGKGSVFYFDFPLYSLPENMPISFKKTSRLEENYDYSNKKILIVEDDKVNQKILELFLKKNKYIVEIASNGNEAISYFENSTYDLILMDIQMPYLNGLEASKIIRNIEKRDNRSKTPIIATTAYALYEERNKILSSDIDYYIAKPIDFKKLKFLIISILSESYIIENKKLNKNIYKDVNKIYEFSEYKNKLRDLVDLNDFKSIEIETLKFEGYLNSIDIYTIDDFLLKIKMLSRKEDGDSINKLLKIIGDDLIENTNS